MWLKAFSFLFQMETDSLEDYWTEFRLVRESRPTQQDLDEDNSNPPGKKCGFILLLYLLTKQIRYLIVILLRTKSKDKRVFQIVIQTVLFVSFIKLTDTITY